MSAGSPATTGTPTGRSRFAAVGTNRDFRLLWIGQATSQLGSSISTLALPMLVLAVSGSATLAGLLGTLSYLTMWLAQLPGGYLADMFDRRRVMLVCDLGRAGLLTVAAVAVATSTAATGVLLLVVCVATFLWVAFSAAENQAVRTIVPPDEVPEAIGVIQARGFAMELVGPLLAGWLFSVHHAAPLVVDAATFAVSLGCVWLLRTPLPAENRPRVRRLLPDLGKGWSVLWHHPFLRAKTLYAMTTNFAVSMLMFVLILSSGGAMLVGAGVSLAAVAGLAGSMLAPVVSRRVPLRRLLVAVALLRAAGMAVAAAGGRVTLVLVLATVVLLGPVVAAAMASVQLLVVPGEVLGRASGASGFLSSALQPLAPLTAGLLVQTLDQPATRLVITGAFLAVALVATLLPGFSRAATAPPASAPLAAG